MSKKVLYTLLLIAVTVIALLLNANHKIDIRLGAVSLRMAASFAYGVFTALGVAIGLLLK